ncbi:MAG: hydrogenase maturation nickel metallochaperone HypA [Pseudonocardiaceae bacterium]|nr:hydrogenase maturation nickel metallochaperone HypA [Pseudonocardiaceae bacterium]
MHELSITQSVVDTVCERMPDATVRRIRLDIGRLSGVVADSVRFCFDLVAEGTVLDGAVLEIVESPGRARCRACDAEFEVNDLLALCGCGAQELELLAGQELMIKEVEVAA